MLRPSYMGGDATPSDASSIVASRKMCFSGVPSFGQRLQRCLHVLTALRQLVMLLLTTAPSLQVFVSQENGLL
jgi:hypothetical protein